MVEKFLEGKGALITGGASGFGRGVAEAFAERGADLVLVDIKTDLLEETSSNIEKKYGCKVVPIECDVSKSDQVKAMAKRTFNELDNIYFLFDNAGIAPGYRKDFMKLEEDLYDLTMNVNLKGQWLVAKEICKKMRRQQFEPYAGKVVLTASMFGVIANEKSFAYSLSKAGAITMAKMLAKTLAPKITVNSISPGYHVTGIYHNSLDTLMSVHNDGKAQTPLNRIGDVDDVVKVILFIASDASNFITGHNFVIDGGISEVGVPANALKVDL